MVTAHLRVLVAAAAAAAVLQFTSTAVGMAGSEAPPGVQRRAHVEVLGVERQPEAPGEAAHDAVSVSTLHPRVETSTEVASPSRAARAASAESLVGSVRQDNWARQRQERARRLRGLPQRHDDAVPSGPPRAAHGGNDKRHDDTGVAAIAVHDSGSGPKRRRAKRPIVANRAVSAPVSPHGERPQPTDAPEASAACTKDDWAAAQNVLYPGGDAAPMPYDLHDDAFLRKRSCGSGLVGLWALRRMQASRACRRAIFYAGENQGEPVVEICLDRNRLRGNCTVFSVGIAYNFIFDDWMHSRGCRVFSFDPTMAMEKTVRHDDPLAVFEPVGLAAYDGKTANATGGTFYVYGKSERLRRPPYTMRRLETLMAEYEVEKLDLLRVDTEGSEWALMDGWFDEGSWRHFDQLSMELHLDGMTEGPTFNKTQWAAQADLMARIPHTPAFLASNLFSSNVHRNARYLPSIKKVFEASFVAGLPYRPRPMITHAFWQSWGYQHGDEQERPVVDLSMLKRAKDAPARLKYVKHVLAKVVRDGCALGVQVTAEDAPARVCLKPGLKPPVRGKQPECLMHIVSDRATRTNAELAAAMAEEAHCKTVEFRIRGDTEEQSAGQGGAETPQHRVVYVTEDELLSPDWGKIDALRVDAGPGLTEGLLRGWQQRWEEWKVKPSQSARLPVLRQTSQLSVKLHILDTLTNVEAVANTLREQPAGLAQPYYSALGEVVPTRDGEACTYEVSYVWERGESLAPHLARLYQHRKAYP
eukprot:TRINITY_DN5409_c0_g3_i1.p1 TRINITY_DN5409_c0_g3~~TRINITY_DN5409_c0_g3_i1.p1  ORF type:complete len:757 (+),score=155.68 TRINITY_DN5409_c0_g3_i1:61-2331(+)